MIYISIALLIFLLLRLLVALVNFIWIRYTLRKMVNSKSSIDLKTNPVKWSILIPARNEEHNIDNILLDISRMAPAPLEVIVFNDNSTDNTSKMAEAYKIYLPQLRIIESKEEELPQGWIGKSWACNRLAQEATGDYLLFVDADVRLGDNIGSNWIGYAINHNLSLLSVFPKQILDTQGSRLTVPIMNWILLSLLPLPLVKKSSWSSFSAANGQFMLFKAIDYQKLEPHVVCKESHAEDIDISRFYKKNGLKIATLTGNDNVMCRMYGSLSGAINGFSKNVLHFFGNSIIATILFVLITTLTPLLLIPLGVEAVALWLVIVVVIRILISATSDLAIGKNVIRLFSQHFFFVVIVVRAIVNRANKNLLWKGRNIYS